MIPESVTWTEYRKNPNRYAFEEHGLCRGIHESPSFAEDFKENGFVMTEHIMIVPKLTTKEEQEYLGNPKAFDENANKEMA